MPQLEVAPLRWAELVFHVLAHVPETRALAASLWDPGYVAYAERHLGPITERELGLDCQVLGRVIDEHRTLAEIGLLAWLFESPEQADRAALRSLDELLLEDVADPTVVVHLMQHQPAAEVLRCAALLELELFTGLPRPVLDKARLEAQLKQVTVAAPELERCRVHCLLPLWRRGRVRGAQIWVGLPGLDGQVTVEHVAWQAAHEASVREVSDQAFRAIKRPEERSIEHVAIVLLRERAEHVGLGDSHARWLAHFGSNVPSLKRSTLTAEWAELLVRCRSERD